MIESHRLNPCTVERLLITKTSFTKSLLIKGLILCLGACSFEGNRRLIDKGIDQTDELMRTEPSKVNRVQTPSAVVRMKGPRISGQAVRLDTEVLPDVFSQKVRFFSKGGSSLTQTIADISKLIGLPIKVGELLNQSMGREEAMGSHMGSAQLGMPLSASLGVEIDFEGSVQGLMDLLAGQTNLSWRYNAQSGAVEFYRYETKAFSVSVPGGQKNINASISLSGVSEGGASASAGAGTNAGTGAGNVSVNQAMSVNPWVSIMQGVRSILSDANQALNPSSQVQGQASLGATGGNALPSSPTGASLGSMAVGVIGAQAVANPELGLITVTARPQTLERVQQYVRSINERFAKNVLIDVKIYSFSLDEQKSLGFGLNMLYTKLNQMNASTVSPQPLQAGVDTPGILTLGAPTGSGAWSGSNFVAQALSQLGRVSLLKQAQVLAINGQPSPVQVANEISYVASSATTLAPNVGSITTQTTGTKVVGFTANFLPLILGDGRILLSYQIQISSLASALTPNAQGIQTPNVATQSLQQQAFLDDGQSIVLFGYDEERNAQAQALSVAGLSNSSSMNRDMVVIVLQVNTGAHRVTP